MLPTERGIVSKIVLTEQDFGEMHIDVKFISGLAW